MENFGERLILNRQSSGAVIALDLLKDHPGAIGERVGGSIDVVKIQSYINVQLPGYILAFANVDSCIACLAHLLVSLNEFAKFNRIGSLFVLPMLRKSAGLMNLTLERLVQPR